MWYIKVVPWYIKHNIWYKEEKMKEKKLVMIYEGEMQQNGKRSQKRTTYNNLVETADNTTLKKVADALNTVTNNPAVTARAVTEETLF